MEPRRFHPGRRFVVWALPLVLALAGCTDRELPTAVPVTPNGPSLLAASEGSRLIAVSAGGAHTCGVKSDGTVVCWGDNDFGKATPPAGTFVQVSAGGLHTCGVQSDGIVVCWG